MLTVEGVTVKIGAYTILRGLSMAVPTDSVVALVGRNGAGKTTTMRTIIGLIAMTKGKISLDGHDLGRIPTPQRAKLGIGYLPEDRRLISELTVEQNLMMPARAVGLPEPRQRLETVYDFLPEVKALAERRSVQLSGGQQKLVALGRSFVNARKLLLLDEPFEGLSLALSRKLADVIRQFQKTEKGLSVVLAESDLKRAAMLTDKAYVIERGEVIEQTSIG